ncbi:hypothetical protein GWI33_021077 [Rhynchophorus ferrugineus]|uniref:Uncharacterized protein n=1 Tax=Rhynchophorus ferrugineus TaxID=354439 RepID=A0A834HQB9_RHYFE|nr:hypothetical protein GWI33_021077 [Rhynchophorus ferrugineus]
MGKSDKMSDNVPGISPQTEASKLLEQALMQMDGIISGSGSLTAHSPEYGFNSSPPGVREAANSLVAALQNTTSPPQPDPNVVKLLLNWIQQVSYSPINDVIS